jgi:hypothetical protein
MGWGKGTQDSFYNVKINFGRLSDAIAYATTMGWGYDILHPQFRWHQKKDYAANFTWKGEAKPEPAYD